MDSKAIRTAGPQGQQGNRDSRTTSYSLQSNKHQEYTHTILCLTGDCHQLFSTSQQTSSAHSHHSVPVTVISFAVQANKHHQHIHTTLCLWLSSASLYKPTNITSTFTPPCACGCHQLLCTRQQTSSAHSHHPVLVTVTSFSVQDNKHHLHIHTTLCLWLSPASLYKTTNITSTTLCLWLSQALLYKPTNIINNTFTPSCILGVTVTSYSVQANKHPQEHAHTILCLGLTCHQLLSTTTSQQTSSWTHSHHPVTVTNHSLPANRCDKHSHLPVSSGPLEWWSCHVLWHLTAHCKEMWTMEGHGGHSGKERTVKIETEKQFF